MTINKTSVWTDASAYEYTQGLKAWQWAWEFLRRNTEYIQDYTWFIQTWSALENKYGQVPNRDFARWKNDPRAYRRIEDASLSRDNCAVENDADLLLIECWMGAKWGFYKFPCDPARNASQLEEPIPWHPPDYMPEIVSPDSAAAKISQLDLRFNLDLPLKEQIQHAGRLLALQKRNLAAASMNSESLPVETWTRYLRLLDAISADSNEQEIRSCFYNYCETANEAESQLETDLQCARQLCMQGYRNIPHIEEKQHTFSPAV